MKRDQIQTSLTVNFGLKVRHINNTLQKGNRTAGARPSSTRLHKHELQACAAGNALSTNISSDNNRHRAGDAMLLHYIFTSHTAASASNVHKRKCNFPNGYLGLIGQGSLSETSRVPSCCRWSSLDIQVLQESPSGTEKHWFYLVLFGRFTSIPYSSQRRSDLPCWAISHVVPAGFST